MAWMRRSEFSLWELALSFHSVGSRDQIQVVNCGGKDFYLQSHLADLA